MWPIGSSSKVWRGQAAVDGGPDGAGNYESIGSLPARTGQIKPSCTQSCGCTERQLQENLLFPVVRFPPTIIIYRI
jgi:hypothetical protein